MDKFPHLNFAQKITGVPRLFGGGETNPLTQYNKDNRQTHSNNLSQKTANLKGTWINALSDRESEGLAQLETDNIPIFLKINTDLITNDFDLQGFGIEIISEEDDGFIIGASLDGLRSLEEKINGFAKETYGTGLIADLYQIIDGNREEWKPLHILSEELLEKWRAIEDDKVYKVETSIAFDKPLGREPDPNKRGGEKRLQRYRDLQVERDDRLIARENHFDKFINHYGQRVSDLVHLEDSFGCEVEITGRGLKDLVFNYPFVFEVTEVEQIENIVGAVIDELDFDLEILSPDADSPEIGIIDSGIMEGHKYISPAIISANSKSYLDKDDKTADFVQNGGHGTRVAGAVLFPVGISTLQSPYQLPCFVRNLRVLDNSKSLNHKFPAKLMQTIVDENEDCKIFNLSINSVVPFRKKHMSTWAATIDSIIYGKNVLFIISSGNITKDIIRYYIKNGNQYPNYLHNPYCRLANPAQSSFALTVGSINLAQYEDTDWKSLGNESDVSAFSRIGLGIWGTIKPDVVELGGGLNISKNGLNLIRENEHTTPELIRSTLSGGAAYGKDSIGTSYAAPKVTHIVAQLKKLYPAENINLFRALVVQGARLPNHHFYNPTLESMRYFGYGLPSIDRVTQNTEQRISFYNTGEIKVDEGHIYSLRIPQELRDQGNEYDVLIEISLAYTAKVRRTRQKTKSYLSTWLDWTTSKLEESFEKYRDFVLREIENTATQYDKEARKRLESIKWKICDRSDRGEIEGVNRSNSTVQKDWAILKSYQLPKDLSIAVRAHKGWDNNSEEVPYALVVSLEVLNVNVPIYEAIRVENEIEIPV